VCDLIAYFQDFRDTFMTEGKRSGDHLPKILVKQGINDAEECTDCKFGDDVVEKIQIIEIAFGDGKWSYQCLVSMRQSGQCRIPPFQLSLLYKKQLFHRAVSSSKCNG
jgi:hypothetical protein